MSSERITHLKRESMNGNLCPYCPKDMKPRSRLQFVVRNGYATNVCPVCGEEAMTEREYQRMTRKRTLQAK